MITQRNLNNDFSEYLSVIREYSSGTGRYSGLMSFRELLDKPYAAYYILSGCCRLLIGRSNGQQKVNAVLKEGSFLQVYSRSQAACAGDIMMFEPFPEVEVLLFEKDNYERMLSEHPEIMRKLLTFFEDLTVSVQCDMYDLLYTDGYERLVRFLHRTACQDRTNRSDEISADTPCTITATQEMISDFIALDRTNVARAVGALKKQGILETRRGRIIILDFHALAEQSESFS